MEQHHHILVTIDNNYLSPLKVMLKSLFNNNLGTSFTIHLIYNDVSQESLADLTSYCAYHEAKFQAYLIAPETFAEAPTSERYSQAMYFRLLAFKVLPPDVDKILYLDPDIIILNNITQLYQIDIRAYLFAAAIHTQLTRLSNRVNKIRLGTFEAPGYFNSGVMLMNLAKQRQELDEKALFDYIQTNEFDLILPDQDVLNGLYGAQMLAIDDSLYNYDTRNFETYLLLSGGEKTMTWVIRNTVILHFCGKNKPWKRSSATRFAILFKHYEQLMLTTPYI